MEYRTLSHGGERVGVFGIGTGGIQNNSDREIERIIRAAIENGIHFFDLCAGAKNVYAPFGRAIAGQREKIMFQLHFGAVYNGKGHCRPAGGSGGRPFCLPMAEARSEKAVFMTNCSYS